MRALTGATARKDSGRLRSATPTRTAPRRFLITWELIRREWKRNDGCTVGKAQGSTFDETLVGADRRSGLGDQGSIGLLALFRRLEAVFEHAECGDRSFG